MFKNPLSRHSTNLQKVSDGYDTGRKYRFAIFYKIIILNKKTVFVYFVALVNKNV